MAQTSVVAMRAERDLESIGSFVADLPNLAEEWESLEEAVQVSFSLEWDHLMADYLLELAEYARDGSLTPDQQQRYRQLLCEIKDVLPIIEQLNWYWPPVSLDVAA